MDKSPQGKTPAHGSFLYQATYTITKETPLQLFAYYYKLHGPQVSFKDHKYPFRD